MDDQTLLRRFEPVLRFTRGETFLPTDVETYVSHCSLWVQRPAQDPQCLIPQDSLTLDMLAQPRPGGPNVVYFLRFIEPLDILNLIAYLQQKRKKDAIGERFSASFGRLARVGYSSRFADLLFSLSLLLRGRVPGDTSAAAALEYQRILAENDAHCYYGRVVRQAGWVVLQYWYFYAFNDWRSGFFGVNDHEADWEMVNIYLEEVAPEVYSPEWVAYASHDFTGDDLRRRWDDPELHKNGEHPVVFVGAGSHASYYASGEYLAEIELPFLTPLARTLNWIQGQLNRFLGNHQNNFVPGEALDDHPDELLEHHVTHELPVFRAPFVDYARGDGRTIGPGGDREWSNPVLIGPDIPGWVSNYSGLWGLFARDPISGENAPAGPMYNRNTTVRRAWYDPVGWAGLDKVPPPGQALSLVREQKHQLRKKLEESAALIEQKSAELSRLGAVCQALSSKAEYMVLQWEQQAEIAEQSKQLDSLRSGHIAKQRRLEALLFHEQRLMKGERGPLRAHIRRAHGPASPSELQFNRLVELWAALSIGLLMIGFVALALFSPRHLILGLVLMISFFVFIESGFRRQLHQLINSIAIGLAIVSALVILFHFFWWIVVLCVLWAGIYILWQNMRELAT
jgi:hypothetical protein